MVKEVEVEEIQRDLSWYRSIVGSEEKKGSVSIEVQTADEGAGAWLLDGYPNLGCRGLLHNHFGDHWSKISCLVANGIDALVSEGRCR